MNQKNKILRGVAIALTAVFLSAGCSHRLQNNNFAVEHCTADTVASLHAEGQAPACSLSVDLCYLTASADAPSGEDSVARIINTTVMEQLLGEDYAALPTTDAVGLFKTNYLNDYRQDMQELYAADVKNQVAEDELPSWYNRSFELKTEMKDGREGILCTTADIYEFAGGAHPNTWQIWMNFRLTDGHLLTVDEVFKPTMQDAVSDCLLDALIDWMRDKLDNKDIHTVSDLQNEGVLLTAQLYVPDNFLLLKDEVRFVYNRYDIAPYALGAIELALPYDKIKDCLNLNE